MSVSLLIAAGAIQAREKNKEHGPPVGVIEHGLQFSVTSVENQSGFQFAYRMHDRLALGLVLSRGTNYEHYEMPDPRFIRDGIVWLGLPVENIYDYDYTTGIISLRFYANSGIRNRTFNFYFNLDFGRQFDGITYRRTIIGAVEFNNDLNNAIPAVLRITQDIKPYNFRRIGIGFQWFFHMKYLHGLYFQLDLGFPDRVRIKSRTNVYNDPFFSIPAYRLNARDLRLTGLYYELHLRRHHRSPFFYFNPWLGYTYPF